MLKAWICNCDHSQILLISNNNFYRMKLTQCFRQTLQERLNLWMALKDEQELKEIEN